MKGPWLHLAVGQPYQGRGVTVLVTHHQNTDARVKWAIDYGAWEAGKREPAALTISGRANSWVLDEQFGNAFELVKEPCRYGEVKLARRGEASRSSDFSA